MSKIRVKYKIKNGVQNVGMRAIVTSILLEEGLERGKVENKDNHVEVVTDVEESKTEEVKKMLEKGIEEMQKEDVGLPENIYVEGPERLWDKINSITI